MKTSWRKQIQKAMNKNNDSGNYISSLSEIELDTEFDNGHTGTGGVPFTLWTASYVYFPLCYDGSEWCGSASIIPDGKPTDHQGGGY